MYKVPGSIRFTVWCEDLNRVGSLLRTHPARRQQATWLHGETTQLPIGHEFAASTGPQMKWLK